MNSNASEPQEGADVFPELCFLYEVVVDANKLMIMFRQVGAPYLYPSLEANAAAFMRFGQAYVHMPFYSDAHFDTGIFRFEIHPQFADPAAYSTVLMRLLIEDTMLIVRLTYGEQVKFLPRQAASICPNIF